MPFLARFYGEEFLLLVQIDFLGGKMPFPLVNIAYHNRIAQVGAYDDIQILAALRSVVQFHPDGLETVGEREIRARDAEGLRHGLHIAELVGAGEGGTVLSHRPAADVDLKQRVGLAHFVSLEKHFGHGPGADAFLIGV